MKVINITKFSLVVGKASELYRILPLLLHHKWAIKDEYLICQSWLISDLKLMLGSDLKQKYITAFKNTHQDKACINYIVNDFVAQT